MPINVHCYPCDLSHINKVELPRPLQWNIYLFLIHVLIWFTVIFCFVFAFFPCILLLVCIYNFYFPFFLLNSSCRIMVDHLLMQAPKCWFQSLPMNMCKDWACCFFFQLIASHTTSKLTAEVLPICSSFCTLMKQYKLYAWILD